jgi:hypothetical protein
LSLFLVLSSERIYSYCVNNFQDVVHGHHVLLSIFLCISQRPPPQQQKSTPTNGEKLTVGCFIPTPFYCSLSSIITKIRNRHYQLVILFLLASSRHHKLQLFGRGVYLGLLVQHPKFICLTNLTLPE